MTHPPLDRISAYADGEVPAEEARTTEAHIAACTECARELALIHAIGGAMKAGLEEPAPGTVWYGVHRAVARGIGWILLLAGIGIWAGLALTEWFRSGALEPEWLAGTAIMVGLLLLLVSVGYEQYRAWKHEPYRHIER